VTWEDGRRNESRRCSHECARYIGWYYRFMRGKWFVLVASIVLLALVGAGVAILLRAKSARIQAAPPPVTQAPVPTGDINLSGKIRPQQVVSVSPPLEGVIGAFFVEVGQDVFEGQLLARITNQGLETGQQNAQRELENAQSHANEVESQIITARLEASRAQADSTRSRGEYDRLQRVFQRQQMLYNEGATPKLVYEKAAKDFEIARDEFHNLEQVTANAEARVAELIQKLDSEKRTVDDKARALDAAKTQSGATEVVSPTQGVVVARTGEVGQPTGPDHGDLFVIGTQLTQLEVVLDPDPPTLRRVQKGQPALVVLPDQGAEGITGAVKDIQGNQVVVAFTNPNPSIKPGMMAQVRIRVN